MGVSSTIISWGRDFEAAISKGEGEGGFEAMEFPIEIKYYSAISREGDEYQLEFPWRELM